MRFSAFASLILTFLLADPASGGQVDWSSSAFSIHQTSEGTALDDSFIFELGAFDDSFVPNSANTAEWAAYWRVVQRAPYNPSTQIVAGSFVIETNDTPFNSASQGYLWGLSLVHPGEWVLLTNPSWNWPMAGGANPPVSWTVQNATNVIVGQVNATGTPFFLQTGSVSTSNPIPWITGTDWQMRHFSVEQITNNTANWLGDPDGDGKTNLDEMAYDTDPLLADEISNVSVGVSANDTLEMTVTKAPNHVLDYRVQVSSDLREWSHSTEEVSVIRESANMLVVRDRTPLTNNEQRFIRLLVEIE
ncbi:MAG: hypothetical protein GWQ05_06505 [Verrucomicrobiaceae bacterium]|nr:hypothetical protein [Verrucomicrobiaceae bacterium]